MKQATLGVPGRTEGVHPDRDGHHGGHPCADRTFAAHGGCWEPGDPPEGDYWGWALVDGRRLENRHSDG